MRTRPTILFFSPDGCPVPALVRQWAGVHSFPLMVFSEPDEVESIVLRGHPCLLFVDGDHSGTAGLGLVRRAGTPARAAVRAPDARPAAAAPAPGGAARGPPAVPRLRAAERLRR